MEDIILLAIGIVFGWGKRFLLRLGFAFLACVALFAYMSTESLVNIIFYLLVGIAWVLIDIAGSAKQIAKSLEKKEDKK